MTKTKRGIAWGVAIILLLAFPLFALITYQMGLYELSFIDRNEGTSSDSPVITTGGQLSLPIAETEATQDETDSSESTTAPSETDEPKVTQAVQNQSPESFTRSLYAYSTATGYGFTIDRTPFTKSGQIITFVDGAVDFGDRYTLRSAVSESVPYRKELEHGGYTIEYRSESTELPMLSLYGGYLLVDNGISHSLADPTGVTLVADMMGFEPAYLRDEKNRLLFTDGARYAFFDPTAKALKVLEELDPTQLVFGIEYDHDAGYGQANYGLIPFYSPLESEGESEGTLIPAAYLAGGRNAVIRAAVRGEITASFRPVNETETTIEPTDALPEETIPEPDESTIEPLETTDSTESAESIDSVESSEETMPDETAAPDTTLESIAESVNASTEPIEVEATETEAEITEPETTPEITSTEAEVTEPILTEATTEAVTEPRETTEAEAKAAEHAAKREERIKENGGLWGYRDAAGNVVIEPTYLKAYNFNTNGLAAVVTADGTQIFINRYGQTVLDAYGTIYYHRELYAYDGWYPPEILDDVNLGMFYFDSGLVRVRRKIVHYTYDHYILEDTDTLIDASGKSFNIPAGYTLEAYSEGVLLLSRDGKYGYMDITGRWLTNVIYTYARPFHEGLAVVGFEDMYVGMIDREGEFVVPMVYHAISDTSMGIFTAYSPSLGWQVFAKLS